MRYINRRQLKLEARFQAVEKGITLVTLIFLILTDGLTQVANLLLTNPLTAIQNQWMTSMNSLMQQYQVSGATGDLDLSPVYSAMFNYARQTLFTPRQEIILFLFLLLYIYTLVMSFGYSGWALRTARGETLGWRSLFDTLWMAGKFIVLELLITAIVGIGLLFFVLPGFYLYYCFRMARYVLLDTPELSVFQAMRLSMGLSRGYKRQLLAMDLSFLGWIVLQQFMLNLGYSLGSNINPVAGVLLGELAYIMFGVFVLPYRELTAVRYYEVMRPRDLNVGQELRREL